MKAWGTGLRSQPNKAVEHAPACALRRTVKPLRALPAAHRWRWASLRGLREVYPLVLY